MSDVITPPQDVATYRDRRLNIPNEEDKLNWTTSNELERIAASHNIPSLEEQVKTLQQAIKPHGYTIMGVNGHGKTRIQFELLYENGTFRNLRSGSIPLEQLATSHQAVRNSEGKDLQADEARVLATLGDHENIVLMHESIETPMGTMNVTEQVDGATGDQYSPIRGNLRYFGRAARQLVRGARHLHARGIIHRDLKPNNVMISLEKLIENQSNAVKILDYPTAKAVQQIEPTWDHTKGGTSYQHPELNAAKVTGESIFNTMQLEHYSIGATLFHFFTGRAPVTYEIKEDGTEGFALYIEGERQEALDRRKHNKHVKQALKDVPRQLRNMFAGLLYLTEENGKIPRAPGFVKRATPYYSLDNLQEDVDAISESRWSRIERVAYNSSQGLKLLGVGIWLGAMMGGGGALLLSDQEPSEQEQHVQALHNQHYGGFTLIDEKTFAIEAPGDLILDNVRHMIATYENITSGDASADEGDIAWKVRHSETSHRLPARSAAAMYLSTMSTTEDAARNIYGNERLWPWLAPRSFTERTLGSSPDTAKEPARGAMASMYFRQFHLGEQNIAEVFARFYADEDEIFKAQQASGTREYFGTHEEPGYGAFLRDEKQFLIENGIAAYLFTDADGEFQPNEARAYVRDITR